MAKEKERDPVWERVAAELERRGKGLQWLATQLKTSIQRVQNWTSRGLPGKSYADIAVALDESADWLVGLAEPKWKSAKPEPSERELLTPAAVAVAKIYDKMQPKQQEVFVKLLEAAYGADPRARPRELGNSDVMDLDIDLDERTTRRQGRGGTGP